MGLAGVGVGFGCGVFGKRSVCLKSGLELGLVGITIVESVGIGFGCYVFAQVVQLIEMLCGNWCWEMLVVRSVTMRLMEILQMLMETLQMRGRISPFVHAPAKNPAPLSRGAGHTGGIKTVAQRQAEPGGPSGTILCLRGKECLRQSLSHGQFSG